MILIELTAAIDAAGTLKTFYLSTDRFITSPSDTPANTAFEPSLDDPGYIATYVFGDGTTGGKSDTSNGEIVVKNPHGAYDVWANYSFEGRPIVIREGSGGAYPANFSTVLVGTCAGISTQKNKLVVRLRDKQYVFDQQLLKNTYGGTNVLPNGIDGVATDIKGRLKPKVFGKVFNVAPPCVNTSKLTYQLHDGALSSIDGVYDKGAALTGAGDYATSTALLAATPTTGQYITCLAEGLFRLGGSPAGTVTADATQGNAAANRTAGQVLRSLALSAGLTVADISTNDVTALDGDIAAQVGLYVDEERTIADAMDEVANSVGAWYAFDSVGVLRLGRLRDPSVFTPVLTIQRFDILGNNIERRTTREDGIPAYRVTIKYQKLYTTQSNDLAGSVTQDRRSFLGNEFRSVVVEDASIKNQYLLAIEQTFETLLVSATDAQIEATRRLSVEKVRRDVFEVSIPTKLAKSVSLSLGSVVTLALNRFGLSGGKSFVVLGLRYELAKSRTTLTLWG